MDSIKAPDRAALVQLLYKGFISVCPQDKRTDVGELRVCYLPMDKLIEVLSFEDYIQSFRGRLIYQEHAVEEIFDNITKDIKPEWLLVSVSHAVNDATSTCLLVSGVCPPIYASLVTGIV